VHPLLLPLSLESFLYSPVLAWILPWLWVALVPTVVVRVRRLPVRGALAVALPGLIAVTPGAEHESVIRHELQHQKQMRRYSPLGASLLLAHHYLLSALRCRLRSGAWPTFWELWSSNPLEREANAAMRSSDPLPPLIGWSPPQARPAVC
jgi:hypothetical protein